MRIFNLNAHFLYDAKDIDGQESFQFHEDKLDGAQGIMFQCPRCAQGKPMVEENGERFVRGVHSLICWFSNPKNAPPVPDTMTPLPGRWEASGTNIGDLTLNPSVFLNSEAGCRWHGWVKHGDAE
jgi:hypothetical protein